MKLSAGITLTLFSAVSIGWQTALWYEREKIGNFLSNPFRPSRVPQFILDARHPWILENQDKLERLPDAESYLCSLPQASTTDIEENGLDVPPGLFEYLEIDNNRYGVDRPGWPNALLRLREINRCPAALSQAKNFSTSIYAHRGPYTDFSKRILEPPRPPTKVLDLFADMLGNMTSLETLKWGIPALDVRYFEERFAERGLVLPSVRRLEPVSMGASLVRACPNITIFKGRDRGEPEALLQAAMLAPNLKRFEVHYGHHVWTQSLIQDLVSIYLPGIESLGLYGALSRNSWYDHLFDTEPESESALKETLQLLQSLKNLTHLDLPSADDLDVGFYGFPGCGNVYMGPGGTEYYRQVLRDWAEAMDIAATLVVEFLPRLTGFSIDNSQPNLTRYENGTLRASFPWTGRINEWVMDEVPFRPDEELDEGADSIQAELQEDD
ncbi:hypothetical protein F4859DRAFT_508956 [Xylaria cf. heliscus]|nr:hypothetical protein F4859DRAFT_508956 [Xylaria cf. heliscus]